MEEAELKNNIPEDKIRIIIIVCILSLFMIVVFLGFVFGAAKVCNQVDGFLDNKFKCHLDYNKQQPDFFPKAFNFTLDFENVSS